MIDDGHASLLGVLLVDGDGSGGSRFVAWSLSLLCCRRSSKRGLLRVDRFGRFSIPLGRFPRPCRRVVLILDFA